ncbi:hypothetical protein O7634_24660 [Micromonospora sp. WMMD1120]|uniref:hypothetical protein n=1 Tax=Micromonospora sp. WMMD1120 TaxID=3016106 RepID=UPI002416BB38|nr:hypothetical protein [Micromonospora sp. WMMD1120]MDG4809956.1 hypothetical protein [Micromonospora sp. WMMD1120]
MSRARRVQLRRAIVAMVARYGEAERQFARLPLTSVEGRRAGRAAHRRFGAVVRLVDVLVDERGVR